MAFVLRMRAPNLWAVLACAIAWAHGAAVGVARGDAAVRQLLFITLLVGVPSYFSWHNRVARRVIVSVLYFLTASFFMCCFVSVSWFRNPKQPPLPDVLHDLLPHTSDGLVPILGIEMDAMPDTCIAVVVAMTALFAMMHPNRWTILRRFLVIYGSMMVLRAFTVVVTTLPDSHPRCQAITPGTYRLSDIDLREVVVRAINLLIPAGNTTCGDMVFSGHTMLLVMCAMTWHTYYKRLEGIYRVNYVKVFIWFLVVVGLVFIVTTRLHYTLDVLLAVYLTMTIWGAYHRFADDIRVGHRFVSVWLIDGAIIYPAIEWLERADSDVPPIKLAGAVSDVAHSRAQSDVEDDDDSVSGHDSHAAALAQLQQHAPARNAQ